MARAPEEGATPRRALPKSTSATRLAKMQQELPPDLLARMQQAPRQALTADQFASPSQFFRTTPAKAPVTVEARPAPQGAVAQLFQQQQHSLFAQQQPLAV